MKGHPGFARVALFLCGSRVLGQLGEVEVDGLAQCHCPGGQLSCVSALGVSDDGSGEFHIEAPSAMTQPVKNAMPNKDTMTVFVSLSRLI